jgi:hypothetical protein
MKLGATFWWACLCAGGGFLFSMTQMIPQTEPTCKDKEKRYTSTSTTELQLPKCSQTKLSCQNCNRAISLRYLTTSEFAVPVSVIKLMNAIDPFFFVKKISQQFLYIRMYQTDFHNTYVDTNQCFLIKRYYYYYKLLLTQDCEVGGLVIMQKRI